MIRKICHENPDSILILGENCPVTYHPQPQVQLLKRSLSHQEWRALIAATLPGGRKIEFKIRLPSGELFLRWTQEGKVDLRKQNLFGLSMQGFSLDGADLSEANLSGVDLTGADLSRALLFKTIFNERTLFPFGSISFQSSAPCFLAQHELSNDSTFRQAIDRLVTHIDHPQINYIQQCVAIQAIKHKSLSLLTLLYEHTLMQPTGLLRAINRFASLFTSNRAETSSQTEIREKLRMSMGN